MLNRLKDRGSNFNTTVQLEAVSPYVEKILIYQYTGMINKPGTNVFAGHPESVKLYEQLVQRSFFCRA
jgi:hypothetical protein